MQACTTVIPIASRATQEPIQTRKGFQVVSFAHHKRKVRLKLKFVEHALQVTSVRRVSRRFVALAFIAMEKVRVQFVRKVSSAQVDRITSSAQRGRFSEREEKVTAISVWLGSTSQIVRRRSATRA